jgi:hypothetical protein
VGQEVAKKQAQEEAENPVRAIIFEKAGEESAGNYGLQERTPFANSPAANKQQEYDENRFC